MQAQVDSLVTPIYSSGLADGYKCTWNIKHRFFAITL